VLLIPSFKSLIPTCPFIFNPHENRNPSYVKQSEWLKPPAILATFLFCPSILIYNLIGLDYLTFNPVPVAPDIPSPHEYMLPSSSTASE